MWGNIPRWSALTFLLIANVSGGRCEHEVALGAEVKEGTDGYATPSLQMDFDRGEVISFQSGVEFTEPCSAARGPSKEFCNMLMWRHANDYLAGNAYETSTSA